jgi:hypothetical protein
MGEPVHIYLAKAEESLLGAESEFVQGRYNILPTAATTPVSRLLLPRCMTLIFSRGAERAPGAMPLSKPSLSGGLSISANCILSDCAKCWAAT